MRTAIQQIIGVAAEERIEIGMAKDGSGVGGKRSFFV
jgi:hexokinase